MGLEDENSLPPKPVAFSSYDKTISSFPSSESASETMINSTGGLMESDVDFGDAPAGIWGCCPVL